MTSLLLPATATTLLLLYLFPLATTAVSTTFVIDEDGEPLLNGGTYYILPRTTSNGGGLTVASTTTGSPCPLYITQEKDTNSYGVPVKISSPISSKHVPFGPTHFTFVGGTTACSEPLVWHVTSDAATGQLYVAVGASSPLEPTAFSLVVPFADGKPGNYEIGYCNKLMCGYVNLLEENGLLGITSNVRFQVSFKKAFAGSSQSSSVM